MRGSRHAREGPFSPPDPRESCTVARAILNMRVHAIWKGSRHHGSTMAATINRRLMLGDLQARRGQVEHLTPLHPLRHPRCQSALTRAAMRRLMPFDKVG